MDFEISRLHVGAAMALGVVIGVLQFQCEKHEAHDHEPEAEQVVELTPKEHMAHLEAVGKVRKAQNDAMNAAMREVNRRITVLQGQREKEAPSLDDTELVSITFRANNHGEREDCGCKNNPLGGLARHETLVDLAKKGPSDEASRWWGYEMAAADALFNVDAGDLFFRKATADMEPEGLQQTAREHARAVAGALEASPPDALNVGELDLVFGLETYKELVSDAKLPVVSANLYTQDGERPFDGHRVVSRDGKKAAFIGLLKPQARVRNYYKTRKLEVRPPKEAYLEELSRLPEDVDLVVLLSNLGMNETTELVMALAEEGARIDAGIVSNTSRLTKQPLWAGGVPLVEPLNRGKYFGRLDLRLGDEPGVSYANALADPKTVVQDYRRAWAAHYSAGEEWRRASRQIAQIEEKLAERERAGSGEGEGAADGAGGRAADEERGGEGAEKKLDKPRSAVDGATKQDRSRLTFLNKRLPILERRIETASQDLARQNARLGTLDELVTYGDGDDWATAHIVQVKVEMPEEKRVRRALDRFE